ncbi:MAG: hemerythrin domain-containing protein [Thaumarchaeota archaeon]|nr:hemerythrin domain-containing protein [Nitrososphaerota archaeon]MCL5317495.1 hemerythrin domain-containing protein [Nitrososphaerota archaeon]
MRERRFEFKDLIDVLQNEHREFDKQLRAMDEALTKGDNRKAGKTLLEMNRLFRQHTIDEESRVLKMLIDRYGREGSHNDIETMHEHQTIFSKIEELAGMANLSPNERASKKAELDRLLRQHFDNEEKNIFPKALHSFKDLEEVT